MHFQEFLNRVIDDGIAAVRESYFRREPYWAQGAIAGFEACRNISRAHLAALLSRAQRIKRKAYAQQTSIARYWRITAFESEIEWVCNVVSCALINQDMPPIIQPTARGMIKAAEILGVSDGELN